MHQEYNFFYPSETVGMRPPLSLSQNRLRRRRRRIALLTYRRRRLLVYYFENSEHHRIANTVSKKSFIILEHTFAADIVVAAY